MFRVVKVFGVCLGLRASDSDCDGLRDFRVTFRVSGPRLTRFSCLRFLEMHGVHGLIGVASMSIPSGA